MTIEKITQSDIRPLDQVDKINEIIDGKENKIVRLTQAEYDALGAVYYAYTTTAFSAPYGLNTLYTKTTTIDNTTEFYYKDNNNNFVITNYFNIVPTMVKWSGTWGGSSFVSLVTQTEQPTVQTSAYEYDGNPATNNFETTNTETISDVGYDSTGIYIECYSIKLYKNTIYQTNNQSIYLQYSNGSTNRVAMWQRNSALDITTTSSDNIYYTTNTHRLYVGSILIGDCPVDLNMSGNLIITKDTPKITFNSEQYTLGTAPSTNRYAEFIDINDGSNHSMGGLSNCYMADGSHMIRLYATKNTSADTWSIMDIGFRSNGNAYCSFPQTDCCDGQWVALNQEILSKNTNAGSSNTSYTKKVNVPNDGHIYEVIFSGECTTGSSSGNYVKLLMSSNQCNAVNICGARTRSNSTQGTRGSVIIPVKGVASGETNLSIGRDSSYTGTYGLTAVRYRRVGTNT